MKSTPKPPHPGEVLREYLGNVTVVEAAQKLAVSRGALSRILSGTSGVSTEMAIRLGLALGTSPDLWAGLQSKFDLYQASKRSRPKVMRIVTAVKDKSVLDLKGMFSVPAGVTVSIDDMKQAPHDAYIWDRVAPVGREFGSPDYERLEEMDALALKAFGSLKKARRWLDAPHADLNGQSPDRACRTNAGFKKVKRLLRATVAKGKPALDRYATFDTSEFTKLRKLPTSDGTTAENNPYEMSVEKAAQYAVKAGIIDAKGRLTPSFRSQ